MAYIGKKKLSDLAPDHPFSKPAIHLGGKPPVVHKDGKAARITAVWGYDGHWLELTPEEWYAIRCGEEVFIDGPGYTYEGHDFNDTWIFNGGEHELVVLYSNENEDGVGYNGSLRGVEIEESLPQR